MGAPQSELVREDPVSAPRTSSVLQYSLVGIILVWSLVLRGWFATAEPTHRGVYDERFSVRNVAHILKTGSLAPENGFHPSLSYLPALPVLASSEAYADRSGDERFRVLREGQGTRIGRPGRADGLDFTGHGYRLARWMSSLIGALSILLTFFVARKIYDVPVAVVAAFLLAATPWHLRQAAVFKPDVVLVLAVLSVFWFSMKAVEDPSWKRFLIAGAVIGLALSVKFNAIPVVVPLVVAVFARLRTDRSLFVKLAIAGIVSIVVFLLLNPFVISDFALFHRDFSDTLRDYGNKAAAGKMTMPKMLVNPFVWFVHEIYHGWLIGVLAIAGLAAQLALAVGRGSDQRTRMRHVMLLAFPVGYVFIYSLSSQNPLGWHNWIVLIPFTSIAAALVITRGTFLVASRVPRVGAGRIVALTVIGAILAVPALAVHRFTYENVVPSTAEKAREVLRSRWRSAEQRLVYQEKGVPPLLLGAYPFQRFVVAEVDRLADLRARQLDFADGEVFPESRLEGPEADFYRQRIESHEEGVSRISSRWFEARGKNLVVVEHGWRRLGRPLDLDLNQAGAGSAYSGRLPHLGRRRGFVSLELWVERGVKTDGVLRVGGSKVKLIGVRGRPGFVLYLTPRLRVPVGSELPVSVRLPKKLQDAGSTFTVRLHRWQRVRSK